MLRIAIVLICLSLLGGCTLINNRNIPSSVSLMPTDCANERAIINWLEFQERQERGVFTNEEVYTQDKRAIKFYKWRLRYACNPAN
jgi:hypothetical protein